MCPRVGSWPFNKPTFNMTRHVFIFLGTFVLGAIIALAARTASHQPHAGHAASVAIKASATSPAADPHAAHGAVPAGKPVNTVCAICGMDVDPSVPTAQYQGKTIGFGCKMCPPKFQAEPDKYGPLYLRNEVVKR
jgi:hypothetical protein